MVKKRGTIFAAMTQAPTRVGEAPPVSDPPPVEDPPPVVDPLPELLRESDEPLFVLKNVFPFVLFTDKIIVRVNHVDVVIGLFFWSATNTRLQIADIRQISLHFNPFFATLEIIPQGPLEQTMSVSFLWKHEAKRARRIIAGLMEGHQKKVDYSQYSREQLLPALEALGQTQE